MYSVVWNQYVYTIQKNGFRIMSKGVLAEIIIMSEIMRDTSILLGVLFYPFDMGV